MIQDSFSGYINDGETRLNIYPSDNDGNTLDYKWYINGQLYPVTKSSIDLVWDLSKSEYEVKVEISDGYSTISESKVYKHKLKYHLNGATDGIVRERYYLFTDGYEMYVENSLLESLKDGFVYDYWNTKRDDYILNSKISINSTNKNLYANWKPRYNILYYIT